ncbi:MAG: sulfurtransferase [Candidatus Marinimicrobia bacterium]|nr:sulfurtransferase [Candidatus Neomarinimicrobiota bacterium]MCF7827524.1 sulfurtransferase [Candidatus Neomarinimicrobiota bacterium]MCF7881614.1 sulfurtransferase [Candidatus Neomarinimicrobiota bacterium]
MSEYAHPEVLVSTEWADKHKDDENVRLVEVDVDTSAYDEGHIEGAVGLNWETQLNDQVRRDILTKEQFEELAQDIGITNDTTVVFYGDNNNWFAAYALWQFRYYGHDEDKLKIINGGRKKWIQEDRELTTEEPSYPNTDYEASFPDDNVRAYKDLILDNLENERFNLVDVRSPAEFTGEVIAPAGMSETAQRGGHIPGAVDIPWASAVNDDGTFKSYEELKEIYEGAGVEDGKETVAYCRIGERSSHTWFVLKYLLGYEKVRNYDGSWTEWGNLVGAPIEQGDGQAA